MYVPSAPPLDPAKVPEYLARELARISAELRTARRTAYMPTWNGSISDPDIGDGAIRASYCIIGGAWCAVAVRISMGPATTYGSGHWRIGLPAPCVPGYTWQGSALLEDASESRRLVGATHINAEPAHLVTEPTAATYFVVHAHDTSTQVSASVPFTWAAGDQLIANISYPIA